MTDNRSPVGLRAPSSAWVISPGCAAATLALRSTTWRRSPSFARSTPSRRSRGAWPARAGYRWRRASLVWRDDICRREHPAEPRRRQPDQHRPRPGCPHSAVGSRRTARPCCTAGGSGDRIRQQIGRMYSAWKYRLPPRLRLSTEYSERASEGLFRSGRQNSRSWASPRSSGEPSTACRTAGTCALVIQCQPRSVISVRLECPRRINRSQRLGRPMSLPVGAPVGVVALARPALMPSDVPQRGK